MTDLEIIEKLVAACKAYRAALDTSFAVLIEVSRGKPMAPFMPSKSEMWPAMASGHVVVAEVEAELNRRARA